MLHLSDLHTKSTNKHDNIKPAESQSFSDRRKSILAIFLRSTIRDLIIIINNIICIIDSWNHTYHKLADNQPIRRIHISIDKITSRHERTNEPPGNIIWRSKLFSSIFIVWQVASMNIQRLDGAFDRCRLACKVKWSERANDRWQWSQTNGLSPLCFRLCLVNSSDRANDHVHPATGQWNGFSPEQIN